MTSDEYKVLIGQFFGAEDDPSYVSVVGICPYCHTYNYFCLEEKKVIDRDHCRHFGQIRLSQNKWYWRSDELLKRMTEPRYG